MKLGVLLGIALLFVPIAVAETRYAGLSKEEARVEAVKRLHRADPKTSLVVAYADRSFDPYSGRNAWEVGFRARSGFGSVYSGCNVYVWRGGGRVGSRCRGWRH